MNSRRLEGTHRPVYAEARLVNGFIWKPDKHEFGVYCMPMGGIISRNDQGTSHDRTSRFILARRQGTIAST